MCDEENMTQQLFIEFMEYPIKDADQKVLFILDNLKVHHGKIVKEWLDSHTDEIELFFASDIQKSILMNIRRRKSLCIVYRKIKKR